MSPGEAAPARDPAVATCGTTAKWAAEAAARRDKANGEPYDAVAIGSVEARKGAKVTVTGSVDVHTDRKIIEYDYRCEYDAADPAGPSSRILRIAPRQ